MRNLTAVEQQEYQWLQTAKNIYLTKAGISDIEITGKNIRPSDLSKVPFEKQSEKRASKT
jgi:hypothetical protein